MLSFLHECLDLLLFLTPHKTLITKHAQIRHGAAPTTGPLSCRDALHHVLKITGRVSLPAGGLCRVNDSGSEGSSRVSTRRWQTQKEAPDLLCLQLNFVRMNLKECGIFSDAWFNLLVTGAGRSHTSSRCDSPRQQQPQTKPFSHSAHRMYGINLESCFFPPALLALR